MKKQTLKNRIRGWFPQEPKILGKTVQNQSNLAKRRLLFFGVILLLVVVLALAAFQIPRIIESTLPHEIGIQPDDSNFEFRGIINSIEENRRADGWSTYHIYRYYLKVNISEIAWAENVLANWIKNTKPYENANYTNSPLDFGKIVEVGYDYPDNPKLAVGQTIECKGFYLGVTDMPESGKVTIAPNINGSYLRPQTAG